MEANEEEEQQYAITSYTRPFYYEHVSASHHGCRPNLQGARKSTRNPPRLRRTRLEVGKPKIWFCVKKYARKAASSRKKMQNPSIGGGARTADLTEPCMERNFQGLLFCGKPSRDRGRHA